MAKRRLCAATAAFLAAGLLAIPAPALAECGKSGAGFSAWLQNFKKEAAAQGISAGTIAALDGVSYDQSVINADRRQGVFTQSFNEFAGRMVADYRMSQGRGPAQEIRQDVRAGRERVRRARRRCSPPSGGLRRISAPTSATSRRCNRWRRSPMTAGGRSSSDRSFSRR